MSDPGVIASGEETPSPLPGVIRRDNARTGLTHVGHKKYGQSGHMHVGRGSGNDRGIGRSARSSFWDTRPKSTGQSHRVHSRSTSKAQTDDLKELERVAANHKERLQRLEATESALAVVDRKLARSEDEHRKVIASIHSANELLGEKRREVRRVERQLAQKHLEREEVVTAVCQHRKELNAVQRAVRETKDNLNIIAEAQTEADGVRAELCDLRQSVQFVKEEKRKAEAELRKWTHERDHLARELKQSGLESSSHPQGLASSIEEYLTSIHVAERERDELQQQCDFIDKEIGFKQEELEELRDQLEEGIWDSQKKETEIMLLDKTLEQKQKQLSDIDTKLLQGQSELADLRYVFELEESNLSQLLIEKDRFCLPVNELVASLRKDLQSVEMDIQSQEMRLANVKKMESEIGKLATATIYKLNEYEGVQRQLETVSVELATRKSELDKVMTEIQRRQQEVDMLSSKSIRITTEQSNAVSFLDEILRTWQGQTVTSISSRSGIVELSETFAAQLAELMKVAELKHSKVMDLNQSLAEKLSELSAVDVSMQEKQGELDELQSNFEMQCSAFQQMKDEFKQQRIKEETDLTERKQELDKLNATTTAKQKRLIEVETQVASAEQLKITAEKELNKSLCTLTAARQELEEVSQKKSEVAKLTGDYEEIQEQKLTLQNHVDKAVEEKKHIQHRYQKLYKYAKYEIRKLRSELKDLKPFVPQHSPDQQQASSMLLNELGTNASVSFPSGDVRDRDHSSIGVFHGGRELGWKSDGHGEKRVLACAIERLHTRSSSHCNAMKSHLFQQLSSYEERCKLCCCQSEKFVTTLRSRIHEFDKSWGDTS